MCECGCVSNDKRFTLTGPGDSYYLITLRGHCKECDGSSVVLIELLEPGTHGHGYYRDYTSGPLPFDKWPDSMGVTINVGMTDQEFRAKLAPHLIGLDSKELGDDGVLDDAAVDVLLEEMYDDAQTFPSIAGNES